MGNTITLLAPAKLNLFLHIIGRREDGYHDLQTLMQLLDYGDELQLQLRQDKKIKLLTALPGVATKDNLIIKAAKILQEVTNTPLGTTISLKKRIPMGGGLGGGSSNAATTLVGLNALWGTGLTLTELGALGRKLGADVPFFVLGRTAWAEGIGDILEPIDLPEKWYVVVTPPCQVATRKIFCNEELTRNTRAITITEFFKGQTRNDCEPVVCKHYQEVATALGWLRSLAPASLTGTGSCIFAAFASASAAKAIAGQILPPLQGFVARGINYSPLQQQVTALIGV